jgi:Holliday junction resolvase RusA-like endonuclease
MILEFTVLGAAIPKGSTKAHAYYAKNRQTGELLLNARTRQPILLTATTAANPRTKSWQHLVADHASRAMQALPASERHLLADGVRVTLAFYLPRPKTLSKRHTAHTKAPDLDKLARGVFDALTHVCYGDDSQVVDVIAMKRYTGFGEAPRCEIRVEPSAGVVPLLRDQPLFAMGGR